MLDRIESAVLVGEEPATGELQAGHAAPPSVGLEGLDDHGELALIAAAADASPVDGLTHTHYRYPARFSPTLARAAIAAATRPGDLVLDPFVGGGTSCVEAVAAGRRSLGVDISTLATFVTAAKTRLPNEGVLERLEAWARDAASCVSMHRPEPAFPGWSDAGYMRNLDRADRWRLRKAIAQAVAAAEPLEGDLETLARCAVLRTAQWAFDGRRAFPTVDGFRAALAASGRSVAEGTRRLASVVGGQGQTPTILNRSCVGLEGDGAAVLAGTPRLILTSPPYPGVHVLYHRWQVGGGQETAAPFLIAKQRDGAGGSYYTLGDRKAAGLPNYFRQLLGGLCSMAALADERTTIIQVVAFAQPDWQLPRYLSVAAAAGLEERGLVRLAGQGDGRLWRDVPNRRWHAQQKGKTGASREVVLMHRRVR